MFGEEIFLPKGKEKKGDAEQRRKMKERLKNITWKIFLET